MFHAGPRLTYRVSRSDADLRMSSSFGT
jgi:hypothetical protein